MAMRSRTKRSRGSLADVAVLGTSSHAVGFHVREAAGNEDLAGGGLGGVAVAQHPKSRGAVGRDRRKLVLEEGVFFTARTVYQKVWSGLSSMLGAPSPSSRKLLCVAPGM